jgi:hypothetical protein
VYKDGSMNINDAYTLPNTDGTNGQVLTTDGAGNVSFQTVTGDGDTQNTLDGAYDEGGAGAGRIITADNGAIEIQGVGGLRVENYITAGSRIIHDGDANTFMQFTPDRIEFDAGGRNYIDINHSNQAIVINQSGAQNDFRVVGDTENNMLFVDGSADRLGIGSFFPLAFTHIDIPIDEPTGVLLDFEYNGSANNSTALEINGSTTSNALNIWGLDIDLTGSSGSNISRAINIHNSAASVSKHGIHLTVDGTGVYNTGLRVLASGATTNYAGIFGAPGLADSGNVEIFGNLELHDTFTYDVSPINGGVLSSDVSGNATWIKWAH